MNIIFASELTQDLSLISVEINNLLLDSNLFYNVNPISKSIVLCADIFAKPGLLLLAYSCLRFSDSSKLLSNSNLLKNSFLIIQNKTKVGKTIFNDFIPMKLRRRILKASIGFQILNYDRLALSIENYIKFNLVQFRFNFKSETHIFRHLQCSYLMSLKVPKVEIMKLLGHVDINSQNAYVHNELIDYFSQL